MKKYICLIFILIIFSLSGCTQVEYENIENNYIEEYDIDKMTQEIIDKTNEYRQENGLNILEVDETLTTAANIRASELPQNWSHIRPDGTKVFDWLKQNNYKYTFAGENLGEFQKTTDEVMQMWKDSPSHNENLLNSYTKIGVGIYKDNKNNLYFAQIFSK